MHDRANEGDAQPGIFLSHPAIEILASYWLVSKWDEPDSSCRITYVVLGASDPETERG